MKHHFVAKTAITILSHVKMSYMPILCFLSWLLQLSSVKLAQTIMPSHFICYMNTYTYRGIYIYIEGMIGKKLIYIYNPKP